MVKYLFIWSAIKKKKNLKLSILVCFLLGEKEQSTYVLIKFLKKLVPQNNETNTISNNEWTSFGWYSNPLAQNNRKKAKSHEEMAINPIDLLSHAESDTTGYLKHNKPTYIIES